jgi:hypothetical protein
MEFVMPHSAIAVFTGDSHNEILEVGGSASWVVAEKQARRREYLVCIRNAREVDFPDHEPHGTAFLVGKISGLTPYGYDRKGMPRWIINISEYALVDYPEKWGEWRNPVKYTTLEELGIDLKDLTFKPMPAPTKVLTSQAPSEALRARRPLTISEAKAGLALQFGVPTEAIEILIKG